MVSKVLTRYRVPLLGHIDLNTGVRVRTPKPVHYERLNLGRLLRYLTNEKRETAALG
jgi:hypothetical protein